MTAHDDDAPSKRTTYSTSGSVSPPPLPPGTCEMRRAAWETAALAYD